MRSICKIPKWCYFILFFFPPGMNVTLRNKDSHQEGRNEDSHGGFSCRSSSGLFPLAATLVRMTQVTLLRCQQRRPGFHLFFILPLSLSQGACSSCCEQVNVLHPQLQVVKRALGGCLQLDRPAVQMCCPRRCCSRRVWAWSRFMDSN